MIAPTFSPTVRRVSAALLAFFVLLVGVVVTAAPAAAHDELLESDPADGATVEVLPDEMTFTFSAVISSEPGASEVVVTDAAGTELMTDEPYIEENVLIQPLDATLVTTAGDITVLWKVVSSDGHPISGEIMFTVSDAPTPTATPTPTTEPTESASPTPTEATPTPTATDAAEASDGSAVVPWIIVAVLGVLVVAASAYLIISRARRKAAGEAGDGGSSTTSER